MAKFWNKLTTKRDGKLKFDNYSICIIQTKNENSIENLKKKCKNKSWKSNTYNKILAR